MATSHTRYKPPCPPGHTDQPPKHPPCVQHPTNQYPTSPPPPPSPPGHPDSLSQSTVRDQSIRALQTLMSRQARAAATAVSYLIVARPQVRDVSAFEIRLAQLHGGQMRPSDDGQTLAVPAILAPVNHWPFWFVAVSWLERLRVEGTRHW